MNNLGGYRYDPRCKTCNARGSTGRPLREQIDAMIAQGKRNVDCIGLLSQYGVTITERNFSRHLTKHSPFAKVAKQIQSSKAIQIKHQADLELKDAHDAVQKIVAMGNQMVDNWWNQVDGAPKLAVSERLFIEAVKEEGRRAPRTSIDIELDEMERRAIESHPK
ncbi:MAG: hypothetical protein AAB783_01125 [Patescibacteria group bacterium]